ncbi:hypothetical protein ES288_D12G107100v1 [Gossypium darwinii]|uniref:RNase H type-1 domain-containing protein n=1 Tax=Gossypium darwinii TaxID=34276 RepID=A0A5D2A6W1_GOSDA|nr:hypothetical protein ES288_D12G107100v1 [Gossypium darwinii]
MCPRCNIEAETPLHISTRCGPAQEVWRQVNLEWTLSGNHEDYWSWFTHLMRSSDTHACFTIAITIWGLWYARNRHVMEGKQQHALEISAKVISLVRELKEFRAKLPEARITMKQSWTPPTDPMLKLNFDTAFHAQSRQSSSGFVVRNAQGQVLGSGMVRNNFVSDPFMAEMLACLGWSAICH